MQVFISYRPLLQCNIHIRIIFPNYNGFATSPFVCILHSASYSLTLLDAFGTPTSNAIPRFLISLVELQSRNILRLIAFSEIFLMPMTVVYLFTGRTWVVVPLVYYRFLGLRYSSRRNPYTRAVFYELRLALEQTANVIKSSSIFNQ